MRRPFVGLLSCLVMASALVVLPTVSAPAAAARPVAPTVQMLPLTDIDTAVVAAAPAPEQDEVDGPHAVAAAEWRPVAATRLGTTTPFEAVGVTWSAGRDADVAVSIRTRSKGGWSEWVEVEVQGNATPDPGTAEAQGTRAGSDPLYVGPSDGVQVRVDAGAVKPRDLRLALIDPGSSPADSRATSAAQETIGSATAHAAEALPTYVTRAQWGAKESLRRCTPGVASTIKGGILHTTATSNDYTADQSAAIMRSMYAYHTQSLGWCDLGYNFVVDKFGTLFEGRYGGVDRAVIGAHTGGFNTYTFGVAMIGHHDLVAPTTAMRTMVERVFAWKLGLYGLDATGTTTYTSGGGSSKFSAGTVVTMPVISGHRDYAAKSCPGNYAYPLLPSIRTSVAARMGTSASSARTATVLTLSTAPRTITFGTATTLRGRLTTSDGTPLGGKPLALFVRAPGTTTWTRLSSPTTSPNGTWDGSHAARSNLEYRVRFRRDPQYAGALHDGSVNVATAVRAVLSRTTAPAGAKVRLRGSVRPAHAGQKVRQQQRVNGVWKTVATTRLNARSRYRFVFVAKGKGPRYFRVVKPADSDHVKGFSDMQVLTVS